MLVGAALEVGKSGLKQDTLIRELAIQVTASLHCQMPVPVLTHYAEPG